MIKVIKGLVALSAAILLLVLTGCSPAVSSGIVVAKDFKEAYTTHDQVCSFYQTVPEYGQYFNYNTGNYEYGYQNVQKCASYKSVPREVPAEYTVTIEDRSLEDSKPAKKSVTKYVFEQLEVGYFFDAESGEIRKQ